MSYERNRVHLEVKSDFLIIGSGLAGLYAALYASKFGKVTVLTKSTVEESNSFWAQGGIAAAIDPEDSAWFHIEDTLRAGRGLCNERAVELLVNEGIERVTDLIDLGMEFDMGDKGLDLGLEGGHTKRRILHAGGSSTGREMVSFLIAAVEENPGITKHESTGVVEFLSRDGRCYGALALDSDFEPRVFTAGSTILATGGASALYERTTNPGGSTGEGISIAYQSGARVTDMEFVQFHPTAFYSEDGGSFLISEAVRGEGAHLINTEGRRFMADYSDLGELAPRDVVSRSIYKEMKESGKDYVYLNLKHMDAEIIKSRFGNIYLACREFGVDITMDMIPVAPAAHYTIGGVSTGLRGETNIKGLFACGEVACSGVHGANRLASNSLLECIVFAKRAVDGALQSTDSTTGMPGEILSNLTDYHLSGSSDAEQKTYIECRKNISSIMNRNVGIVRSGAGLQEAARELKECSGYLDKLTGYFKIKLNMILQVSLLIVRFSQIREESRGVHIREDFPVESPGWKSHIVLERGKEPQILKV
jgi:L-aspartate oxidase